MINILLYMLKFLKIYTIYVPSANYMLHVSQALHGTYVAVAVIIDM